jgi:hypothetical protein
VPELLSSQSLNRYTYVLNNPMSRVDPTGKWSLDIGVGIGTLSFSNSSWVSFDFNPSLGIGFSTGTYGGGYGFNALLDYGSGLDVALFAGDSILRFGVSPGGPYAAGNGWSLGNAPPATTSGRAAALQEVGGRLGFESLPSVGGESWKLTFDPDLRSARGETTLNDLAITVGPYAMMGRSEDLAYTVRHEFSHARSESRDDWESFVNGLMDRHGVLEVEGQRVGKAISELRAYRGDLERARELGISWSARRNSQIQFDRYRNALNLASPGLADDALR